MAMADECPQVCRNVVVSVTKPIVKPISYQDPNIPSSLSDVLFEGEKGKTKQDPERSSV